MDPSLHCSAREDLSSSSLVVFHVTLSPPAQAWMWVVRAHINFISKQPSKAGHVDSSLCELLLYQVVAFCVLMEKKSRTNFYQKSSLLYVIHVWLYASESHQPNSHFNMVGQQTRHLFNVLNDFRINVSFENMIFKITNKLETLVKWKFNENFC